VSLRGPTRTRCSASTASMSPHNCTRELASKIKWSQTLGHVAATVKRARHAFLKR
jgi:hypothetical protein